MNPDKFDTKACLTAALEHTNTLYITLQKACTEIEQLRSELFNVRGELFDARQQLERYGAGIWCARCNAHFDTVGMTFDEQNAVMNAHFEECPNNPRAAELKTLRQQLANAQQEVARLREAVHSAFQNGDMKNLKLGEYLAAVLGHSADCEWMVDKMPCTCGGVGVDK